MFVETASLKVSTKSLFESLLGDPEIFDFGTFQV